MTQVDFLFLVIMMLTFISIATLLVSINLVFKMNKLRNKIDSIEECMEQGKKKQRKKKHKKKLLKSNE